MLCSSVLWSQPLQQVTLQGDATAQNKVCFTLTPDISWNMGVLWGTQKIDITKDATFEFKLNFGTKKDPLGADGIVFILADTNRLADTAKGKDLGIRNMKPSLAVEFDVFKNVDRNDPDPSHLAFQRNGNTFHRDTNCLSKFPTNDGWIQMHPTKLNVQDGMWYDIKVIWEAAATTLAVYVDGSRRQGILYDMKNKIFPATNSVYWGIIGVTGGVGNVHQVCFNWDTLTPVDTTKISRWFAPNTFTPNGDQINDVFNVITTSDVTIENFMVFSRWGNVVHDGTQPWDGRFNGEDLPAGVFVWTATLLYSDGKKQKIKGDITLVR